MDDDASITFAAPWSTLLKGLSVFASGVLLAIAAFGVFFTPPGGPPAAVWAWRLAMVAMPIAVVVGTIPFAIRGYVLTPEALYVLRPGWRKRIDLTSLQSAVADPDALRRSFKTLGNNGLFSITGWYYSRKLGHFRAWATDAKRAVVLKFDGRTCVVTPDDPQAFVAALGL